MSSSAQAAIIRSNLASVSSSVSIFTLNSWPSCVNIRGNTPIQYSFHGSANTLGLATAQGVFFGRYASSLRTSARRMQISQGSLGEWKHNRLISPAIP